MFKDEMNVKLNTKPIEPIMIIHFACTPSIEKPSFEPTESIMSPKSKQKPGNDILKINDAVQPRKNITLSEPFAYLNNRSQHPIFSLLLNSFYPASCPSVGSYALVFLATMSHNSFIIYSLVCKSEGVTLILASAT